MNADLPERRPTDTHQTDAHSPWPPKAPLPHVATAAPLGHAASSRMRGADALAQALDLLANHRGISHDRRLGDHARVMQVEDARASARAPVLGAVARVLARRLRGGVEDVYCRTALEL